jgi:translocation and assembly module TamB
VSRSLRTLGFVVLALAIALALAVAALLFFTRTEVGLERVRRVVVHQLERRVQGDLRIERITSERGFLGGATIHRLEIADTLGRPFVRADSLRLSYGLRDLVAGRISFSRVSIDGAEVYLERLPGDTLWNFQRIFADTTPGEAGGAGPLILFEQARITNSRLVVRYPWAPDEPIEEPDDTARLILREAPGGLVRELRFEDVNADLPQVLWESPLEEGRMFRVRSLSTRGYIWEDPFDLRDLRGVVTMRDSVIAFDIDRFQLPATRGSGLGRIITGEETRYDIEIDGDEVALADLRWLYPPLPEEGGGNLKFRIQTVPQGTLWLARDARIRTPTTEMAGNFGIVTGDTLYLTEIALRASPLDLELLERVLPIEIPVEGVLVGTVEVEGPISSLTTRGDLRLVARGGETSPGAAVRWHGTVDLSPPYGVQNLVAEIRRLDLALLSEFRPSVGIGGHVDGRIEATGRFDRDLRFAASLRHRVGDGAVSSLEGQGRLTRIDGRRALDATIEARPLALDGVAAAFPALARLTGEASGPIHVRGALDDLAVDADLATSAGRLRLDGGIVVGDGAPRYRGGGRLENFRLAQVLSGLDVAETILDASFGLEGEGVGLDSVRAELRIDIDSAHAGEFAVHNGAIRVDLRDGLARVDSFTVLTNAGRLDARGTLGLGATRSGTLRIRVDADSLGALRTLVFPDAPAQPLEDTLRYRLGGSGSIEAEFRGSLAELEVEGRAGGKGLVYDGVELRSLGLEFSAAGLGTEGELRYAVRASGERLDIYGRHLDSATVVAEYGPDGGRLTATAGAAEPEFSEYRLASDFHRTAGGLTFDLREVHARTGAEVWALGAPASIEVGRRGIVVHELLLARSDGVGRVRADGRLPWADPSAEPSEGPGVHTFKAAAPDAVEGIDAGDAAFRLDVERLPVFALRSQWNGQPTALASLTGSVEVTGRALDPRIVADLTLEEICFGDARLDRVEARVDYAGRRLDTRIRAEHGGREVLSGGGRIPVDLRLAPIRERRLDEPLDLRLNAGGITAAVITALVDGFRDVQGSIEGSIALRGTSLAPTLGGQLVLRDGAATWDPAGVRYHGVTGTFRVLRDQVVAVDATARTADGNATVSGTIDFRTLDDPEFDLLLVARNFQAANRRDVAVTGTGEVRLRGRFTAPRVTEGRFRVDRGTLYLDEVWRQYQIVTLDDPLFFDVVDTTLVSGPPPRVRTSPFLRNLSVDNVEIEVGRDTWLRGRNLNVEVAGRLNVELDRRAGDFRLTGTLNALRGTYELYVAEALPARRLTVREGTVEFDGTPGINPAFDIVATYRVRTTRGDALNVEAIVTGTLQNPRVALRSDEEPPISESDLLSYLVFGRPTYELGRSEQGQIDSYLAGLGAGLVAPTYLGWGALVLQSVASNFGVDYVSITPAEGADAGDPRLGLSAFDPVGILESSQVEFGKYLFADAVYVAVVRRLYDRGMDFGGRAEWRFAPTWTGQIFWEDRLARNFTYGLDRSIDSKKIFGLFLFREWGF